MNSTKKMLSVLLAVLMVLTAVPFAVFAEGTADPETCTHPYRSTEQVPAKEATCTNDGYTAYVHCKDCGSDIDKEIIPQKPHSFKGEFVMNDDGTHSFKCAYGCGKVGTDTTENGKQTCMDNDKNCKCDICGRPFEHIPADAIKENVVESTCTKKGSYDEIIYCSVCKEVLINKKVETDETGHNFNGAPKSNGNGTHSFLCTNANCGEYGEARACSGGTATCTVKAICQTCKTEYGNLNKDNHTSLERVEEIKATCLNAGHNEYKHCTACKEDIGRIDFKQLNHNFNDTKNCINNGNGTHSYKCLNGCNGYGVGTLSVENGGFVSCIGGTATCVFKAECVYCGKEYGEIDPNNHPDDRVTYIPGSSATCINPGFATYKHCIDCGKDIGKNEIPQLDHRFTGVVKNNGNGTHSFRCVYGCGAYGGDTNCVDTDKNCKCDVCGYQFEHKFLDYVYDIGTANCLNDGTKTATCDVCKKATNTVVDEGSHLRMDHVYNDYNSNNDATCEEDGTKTATCSICRGYPNTIVDEGSKLGHSFSRYTLIEGSATCTENGIEEAKCDRCNVIDSKEAKGSALGHSFTVYDFNGDAECGKDGTETAVCDRCNETDTRTKVGSALEHVASGEYIYPEGFDCTIGGIAYIKCLRCEGVMGEEIVKAVDEHVVTIDKGVTPTCKTEGKTEGAHCAICNKVLVAQEKLEKTGHTYGKWTTSTAATCTKAGKETRKCTVCSSSETRTTKALGHKYSTKWTVDTAATCKAKGSKSHHCTRCNAKTDVTAIAKSAHKYADIVKTQATKEAEGKAYSKCTVCGAKTKTFVVAKIAKMKLSKTSYECDGKVKAPTVTVVDANGAKLKNGTDYTIKYSSGRKKVGTYTVRITFTGKYSGVERLSFKIVPAKVTDIVGTSGTGSAKLSWIKSNGATSYIIYWATEKNGKYKKLGAKADTTATISKLASGQTRYFKVKACAEVNKVKYYSATSEAVAVKIK